MKLFHLTDGVFFIGPDGRWYARSDWATDFILRNLPEVKEYVLWGRLQHLDNIEGYYRFPMRAGNSKVRLVGPVLKNKVRHQWPSLLINNFFRLRKEVLNSDCVLFHMPGFFSMLGYHFVRKSQIFVLYMVGNPEESIPLLVPWFEHFVPVVSRYCKVLAKRSNLACFMSKALLERYGRQASNTLIINNCHYSREVILMQRSVEVSNPPKLIYLGRISREKGLRTLFQALFILKNRIAVHLDIIGVGSQREELEKLSMALGISSSINWLGRLPCGKPLFDALSCADTFVLPSLTEGMPSAIPEAMSQGLPIVATDVGGVREILLDGEAGLIVPPHDSEAMAQALEISITDMELRKRLIQKSLEQAEANCLENQAGKLVDGIAALIRKNKKPFRAAI